MAGSSSRNGFVDGAFSQIRFNHPYGVVFLSPHKLLIADLSNHRLRVLDLFTNTSSSICSGRGTSDGDLPSCELNGHWSLLTVHDVIFVGEYQRIRSIQGKYHHAHHQVLQNITSVATLIMCLVWVQLLRGQCGKCIDSSINLQSMCVCDSLTVVWALFQ